MKLRQLLSAAVLLPALSCSHPANEIKPQRKDLVEMVFAPGVLEADDQSNITAQTDGYLVKLSFKEGDMVREGQVIAMIDNTQNTISSQNSAVLYSIAKTNALPGAPALQQIGANIEAAKAKLQLDQAQAGRYKRLYESNSVSRLEYENAQLAATNSSAAVMVLQKQYDNQQLTARQQEIAQRSESDISRVLVGQNLVRAVVDGRIYEKRKQLGDYVRKGDVIAVSGNPRLIYAKLNVDETNMARLNTGQVVLVRLNTNKGKTYHATLREILPSFDAASQSFLIKAYFTDRLDFRITGTQLESNIFTGEKKNALVIPRGYLDYGNMVTVKGKGQRTVQTGIISTDWAEVLGGIGDSDVLVLNEKK